MSDLLSVLLFVGLFFVMMRFGCGTHSSHGRKDEAGDGEHSHQH